VRRTGVWENQNFRRLWTAGIVSSFGSDITINAFPFTAILLLDATPWHIGLLRIATMAPAFVAALFVGAWVDRVPRRPLMIAADWVRAAILLSIPLAAWLSTLTFTHLMIAAALLSVASTFFDIADRSMLPSLVGREDLADANRMLTAGNTVAETSGFAVSGWLIQLFTAPGALLIDAGTYVWSAITLRGIDREVEPTDSADQRDHLLREMLAGLRYVRRNAVLIGLASSIFLMSFSMQLVGTVYLLFVNKEVGVNPGALGLIFATGGIFSLIASLTGGRLITAIGIGPLLIASLLLVSAGQSLTALATSATLFAVVVMVMQQATDFPWTLYEIIQVTIRQSVTADEWQGRMNGSFHIIEFGGYLLGAIVGGWLGATFGLRETILVGSAGIAVAALPLLFSPIRNLRALPTAN